MVQCVGGATGTETPDQRRRDQNVAEGDYNLSPQAPLLPGEYAVVLRPVAKDQKFSGGDVARGQGPGLIFNAVWSFQVAENAE